MTFSKSTLLAAFSAVSVFGADPGMPGVVRVQLRGQHLLVEAKLPAQGGAQLLQLQPHEDSAASKRLAIDWHLDDGIATTTITRIDTGRDNVFSRFQLVDGASDRPLGQARWVGNIESIAQRSFKFPKAKGIKGLQCIVDIDDALHLGVKQAALNVTLDQLVNWRADSGRFSRQIDGETVYFHSDYVEHIDSQLKRLTDAGVVNSLIIYNRIPGLAQRESAGAPLHRLGQVTISRGRIQPRHRKRRADVSRGDRVSC